MPQVTATFETHHQMDIVLPGGAIAGAIAGYSSGLQEFGPFVQGIPTDQATHGYDRVSRRFPFANDHIESGAGTGPLADLLSEGQVIGTTGYVAAALSSPHTGIPDPTTMGLLEQHFQDVYYRIYAVPRVYSIPNPVVGANNLFYIFNGFPHTAACTAITELATVGLSIDLVPVFNVGRHQAIPGNVVISGSAPSSIGAEYQFEFNADGKPSMFVFTQLIQFFGIVGDSPIREEWKWNTTVMTAYDGTEQRISLLSQPRISLRLNTVVENDSARKIMYDRMHQTMGKLVVVPMYQYATRLTADSLVTTSQLYFDNDITDLRDSDYLCVVRPSALLENELHFVVRVNIKNVSGCTTVNPLTVSLLEGDIIAPGVVGHMKEGTGFGMGSKTGKFSINLNGAGMRDSFEDPDSVAVINSYAGYNILDVRPIVRGSSITEKFFTNSEVLDFKTGQVEIKKKWVNTKIAGKRRYKIERGSVGTAELDYFLDFLSAAAGMRNPFLLPTFRQDFDLITPITASMSVFSISNTDFQHFWMFETFRHVRFTSSLGNTEDRTITAVAVVSPTELQVTLGVAVPSGVEWNDTELVSFLNVVRLGNDKVVLDHHQLYTDLKLSVVTTDSVDPTLEVP